MKYISLIKLMQTYAQYAKTRRSYRDARVSLAYANRDIYQTDRRPIILGGRHTDAEGNERLVAALNSNINYNIYNHALDYHVYPILEMEWLKQKLPMEEDFSSVLDIMAYFYVLLVLSVTGNRDLSHSDALMMQAEELGVIIESDNVDETYKLYEEYDCPDMEKVKVRIYSLSLLVASDFNSLCSLLNHHSAYMCTYLHSPLLLLLFMLEYQTKLRSWSNSRKIQMEEDFSRTITSFSNIGSRNSDVYTYMTVSEMTTKDYEFLTAVYEIILNRLRDINSDLGIISYREYRLLGTEKPTHASLLLHGFDIDWNERLAEVDKSEGEEDENEDEDQEEEWW